MDNYLKFLDKVFDGEYKTYDKEISLVMPSYLEMQKTLTNKLRFKTKKLTILDLGIGTGQFTKIILDKFPQSNVVAIDISKKMMQTAKQRLKKYLKQITFVCQNFYKYKPKEKFDLVVATLSIHHLNKKQKQKFFYFVKEFLKPKGLFVIGDLIIGDTKKETDKIESNWHKYLIKTFGTNRAKEWFTLYKQEDIPESIDNQLKWLRNAGFKKAECVWKEKNLAVIIASR